MQCGDNRSENVNLLWEYKSNKFFTCHSDEGRISIKDDSQ